MTPQSAPASASVARPTPAGLAVRPLEPFGVEIEGDLRSLVPPANGDFLTDLVYTHGLVVARRQSLTHKQQQALVSHFGPIMGVGKEMEYVAPDDGILNADALAFHSDMAFCPKPSEIISLHAVDVVDNETSTRFASGYLAYERLTPAQRALVSNLTAAQVSNKTIVRVVGYDIPASAHRLDRPAVIPHRATGRPVLYVTEAQTARFNELSRADSDGLLNDIFHVLYAPDAVYEHSWVMGDLVIWDNHILQHARSAFHHVKRRTLQRACIGEFSVTEQIENFVFADPV
jgi:alpha-ketoglutarate-dependent taurine dioxygenase